MGLYSECFGAGPDVVLLHGWGLHGGIWRGLVPALSKAYRVTTVDLPGYGHSREAKLPAANAEAMAEAILAQVPQPAVWIGWSLGGLLSLAAAWRFPERVSRIVLVNTTARFTQAPDWRCAVAGHLLAQMAEDLERDYAGTLGRFLSLQVAPHERPVLRTLRAALLVRGKPSSTALRAGLEVLAQSDLRPALPVIRQPALVVHGTRDRLVPLAAGRYLAAQLAAGRLAVVEGAAHAPFLSHPEMFVRIVEGFLHG